MEINLSNSLSLAIKYSLEPFLPIINSAARYIHIRLYTIINWLLKKPNLCTLVVTSVVALVLPCVIFVLSIFFGTLCIVILLLLLEGTVIFYCLIVVCSTIALMLNLITIMYILRQCLLKIYI